MGLVFSYFGGSSLENRIQYLESVICEHRKQIEYLEKITTVYDVPEDEPKKFFMSGKFTDLLLNSPNDVRDVQIEYGFRDSFETSVPGVRPDFDESTRETIEEQEAYRESKRRYTFLVTTILGQKCDKEFSDEKKFEDFYRKFKKWGRPKFDYLEMQW